MTNEFDNPAPSHMSYLSHLALQLNLNASHSAWGYEFSPQNLDSQAQPSEINPAWATVLPDHAALRIQGDDSTNFLQGQLTNDVAALNPGQTQLTSYCSPKGRMLASGWLHCIEPNHFLWLISQDLAAAIAKRLRMYVMRSKVVLTELEADTVIFGFNGAEPAQLTTPSANAVCVELPLAASKTWLLAVPLENAIAVWARLTIYPIKPSSAWRLLEIAHAVPRIIGSTRELFVPQMINFELIGGVNFKKGCYPGQEVVARSQYLGKVKRRTVIAQANGSSLPMPASDVFREGNSEPIGQVVLAAPNPKHGGFDCLVELSLADLPANNPQAQLYVIIKNQHLVLNVSPMPYGLEKLSV